MILESATGNIVANIKLSNLEIFETDILTDSSDIAIVGGADYSLH